MIKNKEGDRQDCDNNSSEDPKITLKVPATEDQKIKHGIRISLRGPDRMHVPVTCTFTLRGHVIMSTCHAWICPHRGK